MTVVAVVDSGLNLKHRDLSGHIWINSHEIPDNGLDDDGNGAIDDVHGFDTFVSAGLTETLPNSGDPQGHGTHVAGIVAKLAPKVDIMPVRILDASGNGLLSDALFGWSYALENGARVINNSFGFVGNPSTEFSFMEEAIRIGKKKYRAVFISAAGNQSNDNDLAPCTPANVPGMISVGATSSSGDVATFSNYGHQSVHLFAPGENIVSADAFSITARTPKSGTSQAAPMVSAFVANVLLKKPRFKPAALERQLFKKTEAVASLSDKSTSGSSLSSKYTIKSTGIAAAFRRRPLQRLASDPLVNFDRFVGVIDPATGMTQAEVIGQLNCKKLDFVDDVSWPFENIAVFTLAGASTRDQLRQANHAAQYRVLDSPWNARKSLKAIKNTGLFDTLEWDAHVTSFSFQTDDQPNSLDPLITGVIPEIHGVP